MLAPAFAPAVTRPRGRPATARGAGAHADSPAARALPAFPVFGDTTVPAAAPWTPVRRPTEVPGGPEAGPGAAPGAGADTTPGRDGADPGRALPGTPAAAAAPAEPAADRLAAGAAEDTAGTTVDHLTATYQAHYRSLLGLAALLLDDTASCEDVVQEAFIRVHSARRRVREPEKTLAYLRQTVVNLSRSTLRRRIMGMKLLTKSLPDMASAEEHAYQTLERDELIRALRGLQRRQREVIVLRYFSDMTEAQVADTLGISVGSVKAYGSRGIAALRITMEAQS